MEKEKVIQLLEEVIEKVKEGKMTMFSVSSDEVQDWPIINYGYNGVGMGKKLVTKLNITVVEPLK